MQLSQQQLSERIYPSMFLPWITSDEFYNRVGKIRTKFSLDEQKAQAFERVYDDVFVLHLRPLNMETALKASLLLNQEESGMVTRDTLGYLVLPLNEFFEEDVEDLIEEMGGNPSDYPLPNNWQSIKDEIDTYYKQERDYFELEAEIAEAEEWYNAARAEATTTDTVATSELAQALTKQYKEVQTQERKAARDKCRALTKEEFTKQFYHAINDRAVDEVIGALWSLAEQGKLSVLLTEDQKIQQLYTKHLTKKYGNDVAHHFETESSDPGYVSYFMQHLLNDTLKMNPQESAALVIHLLNVDAQVNNTEPILLAYGDLSKQQFVWKPIEVQDGKLVLLEG